ncbi:MAG: ABC transporter substrate-binding protein [Chloroflexi bacterium]|nr:ABC transporter substrate-binding protein [Chloroflexota bacterium]
MSDTQDTQERWWSTNLSRRTLLRGSVLGGAGLAAAALIGCGDDDDDDDDTVALPVDDTTDDATDDSTTDDSTDTPAEEGPFLTRLTPSTATPKAGGVLTHGHTIAPSNIDPIVSGAGGTVTVPNAIYDRLVEHHHGFDVSFNEIEIDPGLASSWELSEDGLALTFNLRDDVSWQNIDPLNGRKFTAEDAKFALERYQSDGSVHKALVRKIASIDAVDETTLKLTLSEPWPDALTTLGTRFMTMHPRELVDDDSISSNAIGTGPMILKELLEDRAVFEKNPDYWKGEVLLDGLEILSIPDKATRLARYRVGQLDHAESVIGNRQEALQLLETNPDVRVVTSEPGNATFTIAVSPSNPKYADPRIRQALQTGMDRQLIIDLAYDGLGYGGPVQPWGALFDSPPSFEDIPFYAFNPAEAKKLLMAAGAEDLEIDMIYYNYSPAGNSVQNEILQQTYNELGLKFTAASVDYTQFNSSWITNSYEDAADGWAAQGQQADNWWFDHLHSTSGANRWGINDPELDRLAELQTVEIDPEARREIWRQIWDYEVGNAIRVTKPTGTAFIAYQPWLQGAFFRGNLGANTSYYDWGAQVSDMWLDK